MYVISWIHIGRTGATCRCSREEAALEMGDPVVSVREEQRRGDLEDIGHLAYLGHGQGSRAAVLLPRSLRCSRSPSRNLMRMCGRSRKEAPGPIAEEDEPARIS